MPPVYADKNKTLQWLQFVVDWLPNFFQLLHKQVNIFFRYILSGVYMRFALAHQVPIHQLL